MRMEEDPSYEVPKTMGELRDLVDTALANVLRGEKAREMVQRYDGAVQRVLEIDEIVIPRHVEKMTLYSETDTPLELDRVVVARNKNGDTITIGYLERDWVDEEEEPEEEPTP